MSKPHAHDRMDADEGGGVNESVFDGPFSSIFGLLWLGYSGGLAVGGLWLKSATFAVIGLLALLYGEGFRVPRRKDPEETAE